MQGIASKIIVPTINDGTVIKNFDFSFCDLIKQPKQRRISDIKVSVTKAISVYLKQKNNAFVKNTLTVFI